MSDRYYDPREARAEDNLDREREREIRERHAPAPGAEDAVVAVELGIREARALIAAANMMSTVWEGVIANDPGLYADLLDLGGVHPLLSASMKLETAMVVGGHE